MSFLNKVHYNYRWGVRVYQRQSKRQMLKDLVTHRWLTKWYHPRPTICCCICLCLCLCLCTVSISVFICICLCHQTYQVMSSAPHSPPVFVKVVPSEKRKTPSSSLDDMSLKYLITEPMQERESLDTFLPTGQSQAPPWQEKRLEMN